MSVSGFVIFYLKHPPASCKSDFLFGCFLSWTTCAETKFSRLEAVAFWSGVRTERTSTSLITRTVNAESFQLNYLSFSFPSSHIFLFQTPILCLFHLQSFLRIFVLLTVLKRPLASPHLHLVQLICQPLVLALPHCILANVAHFISSERFLNFF